MLINDIICGNNHPQRGELIFDSNDHIRFQNGQNVSGHNYGCNRRIVITENKSGEEGYTVTIYNMDGMHPVWQNNIQMAPKPMRIEEKDGTIITLRGFGYDNRAIAMGASREMASYSSYGISLDIQNNEIVRAQLNMYDRNTCILYLK